MPGAPGGRAGQGGRRRSQGSGGGEVGADMVVVQGSVGVQRDLGADQAGGGALELEHVEQVAVVGDVAAEPAGGGEGQVRDSVPGRQADELAGVSADLLLGGGRQMRRLGEGLAHAASVMCSAVPGCWEAVAGAVARDDCGGSRLAIIAMFVLSNRNLCSMTV